MKRLRSFVIAIEVLGLITACQTPSTDANTASQKETLLGQAAFKWKTVTTANQQERVSVLLKARFQRLNSRDEHITCIPPRPKTGQALQAQRNQLTGPVFEEEIHGPHPIQVQESDGFGPLGE